MVVDPAKANRDKVALIATVTPVVEGFPVQLRNWDVDDPFDDNNPGMPNVSAIDNDSSGPDNQMPGGGSDPGAGQWTVLTDSAGQARVDVQMSMQPGNNYRAGASTMTVGLADSAISQADVDANAPPPQALLTDMLTVWRHVWVELDSMVAGTDINDTGAIDEINNNTPHAGDGTVELDVSDINDDGRFEGGTMNISSTGSSYTIIDNVDVFVDDDYTMNALIAAGDLDQLATVVDDDTAVLPKTPNASFTVLDAKYRNCYVEFKENAATRDNTNTFVATLAYDLALIGDKGVENADLTPAPDFWVVHIVTCYQLHHDVSGVNATTADGDPDRKYHIHGGTFSTGDTGLIMAVALTGGRNVALFFLETNVAYISQVGAGYWPNHLPRTLSFKEPRTLAHEVGHVFGIATHTVRTLVSPWDGSDYEFDANQIAQIRSSPDLASH